MESDYNTQILDAEERHSQELTEKLGASEQKLTELHARFIEEAKRFRKHEKTQRRGIREKLIIQTENAERLQNELDSLLAEQSREALNNASAQNEIQRLSAELKALKEELSSSQIEQRMLSLRLQNAEGELNKEKSLANTRLQLTDIGRETALSQQQAAFDAKYRALLESICTPFVDIIDFEQPLSDASVQVGLAKVSALLQSDNGEFQTRAEVSRIRKLLEVDDETPIEPVISNLLKKSGAAWEEWAHRVHALVTNSFSLMKTNEELQFALEEILLASTRQNSVSRRLEVLRFEKKILVGGRIPLKRGQVKMPTLLAIISVVASVRKLQRIIGRLDGGIHELKPEFP
jgi:hypothetical protein